MIQTIDVQDARIQAVYYVRRFDDLVVTELRITLPGIQDYKPDDVIKVGIKQGK